MTITVLTSGTNTITNMEYIKDAAECVYQKLRVNRHDVRKPTTYEVDDVVTFILLGLIVGTMWLSLAQL